jgi:hypothetical protein
MSFFLIKKYKRIQGYIYIYIYIYIEWKKFYLLKYLNEIAIKKKCLNHITNIIWKNIHSLYFVLFYTHH